jgi:glycopeptide antibiotics resistance protein
LLLGNRGAQSRCPSACWAAIGRIAATLSARRGVIAVEPPRDAQKRARLVWFNGCVMASRFRRRLVMAMLVVYSLIVFVITLTPQAPGAGFVSRIVYRFIASMNARGFAWVDFLLIEFIGNILMFVPLGIFAALLISRKAWWTLLFMGSAFSGFIELFQATFLPERYPEVRDLVSNTTGFLIGACIAIFLRLLVSHRDGLVEQDRRRAQYATHR